MAVCREIAGLVARPARGALRTRCVLVQDGEGPRGKPRLKDRYSRGAAIAAGCRGEHIGGEGRIRTYGPVARTAAVALPDSAALAPLQDQSSDVRRNESSSTKEGWVYSIVIR